MPHRHPPIMRAVGRLAALPVCVLQPPHGMPFIQNARCPPAPCLPSPNFQFPAVERARMTGTARTAPVSTRTPRVIVGLILIAASLLPRLPFFDPPHLFSPIDRTFLH